MMIKAFKQNTSKNSNGVFNNLTKNALEKQNKIKQECPIIGGI